MTARLRVRHLRELYPKLKELGWSFQEVRDVGVLDVKASDSFHIEFDIESGTFSGERDNQYFHSRDPKDAEPWFKQLLELFYVQASEEPPAQPRGTRTVALRDPRGRVIGSIIISGVDHRTVGSPDPEGFISKRLQRLITVYGPYARIVGGYVNDDS